jgi:hypothetical protein
MKPVRAVGLARAAACLLFLVGVASLSPVRAQPAPEPPPGTTVEPVPPAVAPQIAEEDQQALTLLADLQRYSGESAEDLRRDLAAANQAVARARTDANRVRLAVLLTLPAAGAPDDARALALLDQVVGKTPAVSPVKQIAAILYAQVNERARGVTEERRKTAAAQEKLDQLRAVERSLLLERSRNAGGAGGGGGGGTGK